MLFSRRDLALGVAASLAGRVSRAQSGLDLSEAEIRAILAARVDVQKQTPGLVAAVLTPGHRQVVGHGKLSGADGRMPSGDTVFEIGSLTKVFTGLVFADMVRRGEIGLEDRLSMYMPGVDVPERNGKAITLLHLATHTSGLPRFPTNGRLPPGAPAEVFPWYLMTEGYTQADLEAFLAGFKLAHDPGAQWEYSNVGSALLGMAISRKAGLGYGDLVRRRITGPLGLRDTGLTATPAMARRMATGHELDLHPAPRWLLGPLEPAGGLLSTADDLARLLGAIMPGSRSPLAAANALALEHRVPAPGVGYAQSIGWEIVPIAGQSLPWKTGLTRGCATAMTYDPQARSAVVVLTNSDRGAPDIARHLLKPASPLMRNFTAVDLPAAELDNYAGRYRLGGLTADASRIRNSLGLSFAGPPVAVLTPIGGGMFLAPDGNQITFRPGAMSFRRGTGPEIVLTRAP